MPRIERRMAECKANAALPSVLLDQPLEFISPEGREQGFGLLLRGYSWLYAWDLGVLGCIHRPLGRGEREEGERRKRS